MISGTPQIQTISDPYRLRVYRFVFCAECAPRTVTLTGQFSSVSIITWSRLEMRAPSRRWFFGAGLLHTALVYPFFRM